MDGKKGGNKPAPKNLKNLTQNLKHFCRPPTERSEGGGKERV